MSIRGDKDGSFPSPKYHGENTNEYGESNLTPNFAISPAGIEISDLTSGSLPDNADSVNPLYRFTVHVSPFKDVSYPAGVNQNAVIFLDSTQLFTLENYKFGEGTSISSPQSNEPFYYNPGQDGVYTAPTPLRGAPIQFRRVYFRGKKVDPNKGHVTENEEKTFAAYFPCSLPIEQTITQSSDEADEPIGTVYNSRDLNFSYSEHANILSWEDIDIGSSELSCNPFSGFEANSGDTYDLSSSGCTGFVISGTSGIDTVITENVLTISFTGDASGCNPFSGFESNLGNTYGLEIDTCTGFVFSGNSGINTSIVDNILTISFTGDTSGSGFGCNPFSGFEANSGNTYTLSGSGCSGFTFSGINGIDTSISGNILNISYTGCENPFSGFESNLGNTYDLFDSGCIGFVFSGNSGINTSIVDNVLTISFTGENEANCNPFSGFEANDGDTYDLDIDTCTGFFISGTSGIDTVITENVLTISFTGDASGCNPFSGFESNLGNTYGLEIDTCTGFVFSGNSGINTSIVDNVLTISFTGENEANCNPFSGFEANDGSTDGLSIDKCTGFVFSGHDGINTSITDNVLTISYTGCTSFFTGFEADNGSTSASGPECKNLQINGISGINTEITNDTLKIAYTGCSFPYQALAISGEPVVPETACPLLNFEGRGYINTEIQGDTVIISDESSTFDISFIGENCGGFGGTYNNNDIYVSFDTSSFFLDDDGSGPEVKLKGIHVGGTDYLGNPIPNSKHIAKEIKFSNFDLSWSFGNGGCDSKNIVTIHNTSRIEASGCLKKYIDPITEISWFYIKPDDIENCLRQNGIRREWVQYVCWSAFGTCDALITGDPALSPEDCCSENAAFSWPPETGHASGFFLGKPAGGSCCPDNRRGACCRVNSDGTQFLLGIDSQRNCFGNLGGDLWRIGETQCIANGACCIFNQSDGTYSFEGVMPKANCDALQGDFYEGQDACPDLGEIP